MKTICLIGLGVISKNHHLGLVHNKYFTLTGVCDLSADAAGREAYAGLPFYNDYIKMIAELRPDFVVVATPPQTHFRVATDALGMNCSVLIEKPTAMCGEQIESIRKTACLNNLYFETIFHWQYGSEVLHIADTLSSYGKIKKIIVRSRDPYSADGISIDDNKTGLCGTFLDTGSNAVSLLYRLLDFDLFSLTASDAVKASNVDWPIYSFHRFEHNGTVAEIEVDWREGVNRKSTHILFEDGRVMRLEHSEQSIYYDDRLLWRDERFDRLTTHYYNYYNLFDPSPNRSEKLYQIATRIATIWHQSKNP